MKKLTTIICCVAFMVCGVMLSLQNMSFPGNQTAVAQPVPLQWNVIGKMPLDLQLDLDKRQDNGPPSIRDSVIIRDSVVTKVRWKTRYKTVAPRTIARNTGEHLAPVTPDSMSVNPATISTLGREEQPNETVGTSKVPSIQLTVDGKVVYSRNDNHSGVKGQQ